MQEFNQEITGITLAIPPVVLWIVLGVALILFLVAAFILATHWRHASLSTKILKRTLTLYMAGGLALLCLGTLAAFLYSASIKIPT